jgi:secondary thiamine-phosphate synthase enzyme
MPLEITVNTSKQYQAVDITDLVASEFKGISSGFCLVVSPHTTAAVLVGENEERLVEDYERTARVLLQEARPFQHDGRDGPNGEGHTFTFLHGFQTLIPLEEGRMKMGKLQRIFLMETSGPRERKVRLYAIPGAGTG